MNLKQAIKQVDRLAKEATTNDSGSLIQCLSVSLLRNIAVKAMQELEKSCPGNERSCVVGDRDFHDIIP